jgi:hypothetical protein
MHFLRVAVCGVCCVLFSTLCFAQKNNSIKIRADYGPTSNELLDYYRFEGIHYFRMNAKGETLADKKFIIISKEYWNKKVTKVDTCVNTARFGITTDTNDFSFTAMSKKEDKDSVKFVFGFPRFITTKYFKAIKGASYSLRDPFNGKDYECNPNEAIMLLVYSLPYKDPKNPEWSSYCELSSKGVPPAEWGEKYGVEHYITFELKFQ